MHYSDAHAQLLRLFGEAGLTQQALAPWPAWKVFKRFLREPVEGAASDALVQMGSYEDPEGRRVHLYLVRQFSDELAHELTERDEQFAHLICELTFPAERVALAGVRECWSQDYPSLTAFIDAVESDPAFQMLMNVAPLASDVYWEEH